MNAHSKVQREFIVLQLARWQRPEDIVRNFAVRYPDTACAVADVERLDPRFALLDPELDALFQQERERIRDNPHLAPFATRAERIYALGQMATDYLRDRRDADARAIFRQIAEEQGVVGEAPASGGQGVTAITRTIIDPSATPIIDPSATAEPQA